MDENKIVEYLIDMSTKIGRIEELIKDVPTKADVPKIMISAILKGTAAISAITGCAYGIIHLFL